MPTQTDCYFRQTSTEEQLLYDRWLYYIQTETAEQLLDRFRRLFIDAKDYSEPEIRAAIETLASDKQAEENFKLVLNRVCHILINRWQMQSKMQWAIPALVDLFDELHPPLGTAPRSTRRILTLVAQFKETEQYLTLQRLARVIQSSRNEQETPKVADLIERYPYLYEHCLLSDDSSYEHQQTVKQVKSRVQKRFEFDLSRFVTYQVRLAQTSQRSQNPLAAQRHLAPISNPTLLTDGELGIALKQFVGQVYGRYTYRDLAHSFLTQSQKLQSYREFKEALYNYLICSIDPKHRQLQFNEKLYNYLDHTLTRYDSQELNDFLILRTSSKLLNFLVVESPQRLEHYIFVDMITNMGATPTVGMLLKIALLCRQVKPHLEKRFSILFNHYELSAEDGVPWLVKTMENVHIALSIHFGSVDLSLLKHINVKRA